MKEFLMVNLHSRVTRNGKKESNAKDRNKQREKSNLIQMRRAHTHTHTHTKTTLKKKKQSIINLLRELRE